LKNTTFNSNNVVRYLQKVYKEGNIMQVEMKRKLYIIKKFIYFKGLGKEKDEDIEDRFYNLEFDEMEKVEHRKNLLQQLV
jgi:hypothetical protein